MSSTRVQFLAGLDFMGEEQWVAGVIDKREQRPDGEWFYVRPVAGGSTPASRGRWVTLDRIRASDGEVQR